VPVQRRVSIADVFQLGKYRRTQMADTYVIYYPPTSGHRPTKPPPIATTQGKGGDLQTA
jgi:hypothetical protein